MDCWGSTDLVILSCNLLFNHPQADPSFILIFLRPEPIICDSVWFLDDPQFQSFHCCRRSYIPWASCHWLIWGTPMLWLVPGSLWIAAIRTLTSSLFLDLHRPSLLWLLVENFDHPCLSILDSRWVMMILTFVSDLMTEYIGDDYSKEFELIVILWSNTVNRVLCSSRNDIRALPRCLTCFAVFVHRTKIDLY